MEQIKIGKNTNTTRIQQNTNEKTTTHSFKTIRNFCGRNCNNIIYNLCVRRFF